MWPPSLAAKDSINISWGSQGYKNYTYEDNPSITLDEESFPWRQHFSLAAPVNLGIVTGIFIAFLLKLKLGKQDKVYKRKNFSECKNFSNLFVVFSLLIAAVCTPFLTCFLLMFSVYRKVIKVVLKRKYGSNFVKLLDGTDAVWAIEEDNSKSVINILAIVKLDGAKTKHDLLLSIRKKLVQVLWDHPQPHPKMFYKLKQEFGYFYWAKNYNVRVEDYVSYMRKVAVRPKAISITEDELKEIVGEYCNNSFSNMATWQILVGRQPLETKQTISKITEDGEYSERGKENQQYPVLFRVHHSLGDGTSLMRLLLKTIADKSTTNTDTADEDKPRNEHKGQYEFPTRKCFTSMARISSLLLAPASLIHQAILRSDDVNILHNGHELSGKKVVAWVIKEESRRSLLDTIRTIKHRIPGCKFTDILITALSASLQKHFRQTENNVPVTVTAVLPTRVSYDDLLLSGNGKQDLQNKFTVALLTIPIQLGDAGSNLDLLDRLSEVEKHSAQLRQSPDYQVNYWVMSVVAKVLPISILKPILRSTQSTLAISNLPGPKLVSICDGQVVSSLVFWLPNRGTTGLGFTALGYDGQLNFGLIADRTVLRTTQEAQLILNSIVDELRLLEATTRKGVGIDVPKFPGIDGLGPEFPHIELKEQKGKQKGLTKRFNEQK